MRLTERICAELRDQGDATGSELASVMGLDWKIVVGTLSSLKKQGCVIVVGTQVPSGGRGIAAIYSFVRMPRYGRKDYRALSANLSRTT